MRALAFCLALLPHPLLSDTITLDAPPKAVTAYASGAVITRSLSFDIPAGDHSLVIADMPRFTDPSAIDISLSGATVQSRSWSEQDETPYRTPRTPEWLAAKAALDVAIDALAARDDAIALAEARAQAAQDQITFLNGITLPDEAALDVDALRAIGQLIASDGTAARTAITEATAEARSLRAGRDDLAFAVAEAQAALEAASSPNKNPAALTLNVSAQTDGPATLTVRYISQSVSWMPVYRAYLDNDDTLRIDRGASIQQNSDEDWSNVSLTLSTLSPFQGTDPGTLWPLLRRIQDPAELRKLQVTSRGASLSADMAEVEMPEPVIEEAVALADFSGVGVSYALPGTVTVPTGRDALQIALDTLDFDAGLSARAVPRLNETAFRQVAFTNTSPEILLPGQATLYVDGQLVGITQMGTLPPNADTDMFFGPIEGLRITRTVLDRNEGDRGIITRSNEEREEIRLEVENLTARAWDVELRESVPYSEQEDLVIDWNASPAPDVDGVDDRRGILAWDLTLEPGQTRRIAIETRITWPEGQVLR
ncbi:DUF4139 domain-containing protein [uncultured Tateyamaria sp.]|uniref:DUF4139 domain-containing protein n=1 Tax=Tateyamaria sp. 1078 TaxID=3417464 RepID=UPI00260C2555|nr:DUF4139 domain-containing protein [uncultured Tateyamaria sp.]